MRVSDIVVLKEDNSSNLVTVNSELNPILWKDGKLDAQVVEKLKEIAKAFVDFIGIPLNVVDYTITGSNANYTWNNYSDLDLHIIIKETPSTEQRELFTAKKALWADKHTITIKKIPVECYIQGQDEPHFSTGVYSIKQGDWIVHPKKVKPHIDDISVQSKKDAIVKAIEKALSENDLDALISVKEKIVKMRKAGLERAGEWSAENLAFKTLRNLGLIDMLSDKIRELEDQSLSLETLK